MTATRRPPANAVHRAIVTALLVLGASPVTAPFLTFDLGDLHGDRPASGVAVIQSKPAPDETVPTVAAGPSLDVVRTWVGQATAGDTTPVRTCRPIDVPLRI